VHCGTRAQPTTLRLEHPEIPGQTVNVRVVVSGIDMLGLHNALNEVAHGLEDGELPDDVRAPRSAAVRLLKTTGAIGIQEPLADRQYELNLTDDQAELAAAAICAALDAIAPHEFQTDSVLRPKTRRRRPPSSGGIPERWPKRPEWCLLQLFRLPDKQEDTAAREREEEEESHPPRERRHENRRRLCEER
jgi:hypothetical protein